MKNINIAIDGPAGAGKSTIAKMVSAKLGYIYVDTGALYRTIALYITENNIPDDKIEESLPNANVSLKFIDGAQRVFLGDKDVSELIRTPEISMAASRTSAIPAVRKYLFGTQQKIAAENNVLMDGRDIGTVVLPNADLKIYLTASSEARAQRRFLELQQKGVEANFEEVLRDIILRDEQDMNRAIAPLRQAEDAVLVDTSELNLQESLEALCALVDERLPALTRKA